jgi:hypothetical protein
VIGGCGERARLVRDGHGGIEVAEHRESHHHNLAPS